MKTYLRNLFESVSQSLWLMPSISISLAVLMAYLMLSWEESIESEWEAFSFVLRSGREASLAIVGTLVGSLITVAGVTFSITIVSLTLASSQFGPRLLRNFLQSRASQFTLGALVGSFVYGILIMPGIGEDWVAGEAHPSVTLMIVLACFCVCMIVYYIHHVATSIQADALVAAVYNELEQHIEDLSERSEAEVERGSPNWKGESFEIRSHRSGYVTAIDCGRTLEWAAKEGLQVRFTKRAGKFVAKGETLVEVFGDVDTEAALKKVKEVVFVGSKRTPEQNLEFLIDQLVEVAMRAISPGINDPNTALVCIDYLAAGIRQLSDRELAPSYRLDEKGTARVYYPQTDYEGLVNDAFDQLRQSGRDYPEIVIRLIESLTSIASSLPSNDPRRKVAQAQFEQLVEAHRDNEGISSMDRADVNRCVDSFERTIASKAG
ncbi:DUF2254 domain-containing protein [Pelagicoccus sp. SDUM812002]|uniref:DUF2254 domain-containing protein n=1 Tax=Pelagicoccus sp. SDUM812002 TaxID=3041266 RepID=UPI00280EB176|nr:DUF2254 domain-containing protein [Pelagicoccus sp. SDUM812002]MDQ8188405.1 DUF2254 domain-containing protein [Pelagicoccus sp. SDUM812002]